MLRYKALGGRIVDLRTIEPMSLEAMEALEDLELIKGEVLFQDLLTVRLTVEDASTAIPQLLDWCEKKSVAVDSINEFVPPFDDVFVTIMESESEREEAAA